MLAITYSMKKEIKEAKWGTPKKYLKKLNFSIFTNLVRARSVSTNIRARSRESSLTRRATQLTDPTRNFVQRKIQWKRMEPSSLTTKVWDGVTSAKIISPKLGG